MKNNHKFKLFGIISLPILYIFIQFIFMIMISIIFVLMNGKSDLQNFLNSNIYVLMFNLLIIIFLLKKYRKYNKDYNSKIEIKDIFKIIISSILISLILNLLILYIKNILDINIQKNLSLYLIIMTGIIGPISEELLFRGIMYNKLLEFNSEKKSTILITIIFAFFHLDIFKIFYTLIIGYILIYLYKKHKNIKAPIIFHIVANTFITIIMHFL